MSLILGEWQEGKVRPLPGNAPHDRLVGRGFVSPRSICDDPLTATRFPQPRTIPGPSVGVFQAWRNLSVRCGQATTKSWDGAYRLPLVGPVTQVKERVGRTTLFSSSAMSSGRLFLDRVGRHQSPSPLHRHGQNNSVARSEGTNYHRTVSSVLTVCVSSGGRRRLVSAALPVKTTFLLCSNTTFSLCCHSEK